jgi:hypothetical protein
MTQLFMDQAMSESTSTSTPQGEVDILLAKIAAEHDIDVRNTLGANVPLGANPAGHIGSPAHGVSDDIDSRFASLGGQPR